MPIIAFTPSESAFCTAVMAPAVVKVVSYGVRTILRPSMPPSLLIALTASLAGSS